MWKNKYSKYLFIAFAITLSLFFIASEHLHTEKTLTPDADCPICTFQNNVTVFFDLSSILLIFIGLVLLAVRLHQRRIDIPVLQLAYSYGQRAPPRPGL